MPVSGFRRYSKLWENIYNPGEYMLNKSERKNRSLHFTTRPHRLSFDVPESLYQVFKEIFMEDVYNISSMTSRLPTYPVVIDIGANAGFFDLLLLSKVPGARIYAYEPIEANTTFFEAVIKSNPGLEENIDLHRMAVTGTEKDQIDLFAADTEDSQVVASVFEGFNKENLSRTTVPAITLEKIIHKHNLERIDILKMDCEGSEYDIIYNSPPEVIKMARHLAIEIHDIDERNQNFRSLKKYIEGLGYTVTSAPINNFCHAVDALKTGP
ncbi:MAG: FkbM family methyltransferase [Ferruginibacter sp.]